MLNADKYDKCIEIFPSHTALHWHQNQFKGVSFAHYFGGVEGQFIFGCFKAMMF